MLKVEQTMNAGRKRPVDPYQPHPPAQAAPRTRKKPTDRTLPKLIEEEQPEEYKLYNQLRDAEARVDATILRKRFDLLEAQTRPLKVNHTCTRVITVSVKRRFGCH